MIEKFLTRRNAISILVVISICTVLAAMVLPDIKMDHEFEKFFPKEDPELDRYEKHIELFGTDNDFLLIGIDHGKSVFNEAFMRSLDSLTQDLSALPDVRSVTSPSNFSEPVITPFTVFRVPIIDLKKVDLQRDSARIYKEEYLVDVLFSKNAEAVTLVVECEERLSKIRSDELLERIEQTCAHSNMGKVYMAGRIHGQYYYLQKMQDEFVFFLLLSFIMLLVVLIIAFRNFWGVVVPVTVVILTLIWLLAFIVLFGKTLSIMTIILPTIIFVVGTSDVVHITERYVEELRSGLSKTTALATTYREIGSATFLTSLTTAIGFLTLLISTIEPIQEFGAVTAVGVLLAYVLSFTLLPALFVLLPIPKLARKPKDKAFWYSILRKSFVKVIRIRNWSLATAALVIVVALVGINMVKVNNYLLEDWPDDDPQKQEFFFFEKTFSGVRPFELQVIVKDSTMDLFDPEFIKDLEGLETYLHEDYGVNGVSSVLSLLRGVNKAISGGSSSAYAIPNTSEGLDRAEYQLTKSYGKAYLGLYLDHEERIFRFSGKMIDEGGYIHKQKNEALQNYVDEHFNSDLVGVHQTGMAFLIDRNNEKLSAQLLKGLLIAFVLISIIMAFLYRSLRMILVALIPNIIPLLVIGGIMGYFGIDLNVGTAVIFTIAFGIAVDDTIHFLGKLRIELNKGKSLLYALKRTYLSAGKAIIVTTIILSSGFFALIASDLQGTFNLGLLVSITLVFAVLADLLLIPALILLLKRK